MLVAFNEFVSLVENHSSLVRSLLYDQVQKDEYVALETAIAKEILLFQKAVTDPERRTHVENLEVASKEFNNYIKEQMDKRGCVFDSCDK